MDGHATPEESTKFRLRRTQGGVTTLRTIELTRTAKHNFFEVVVSDLVLSHQQSLMFLSNKRKEGPLASARPGGMTWSNSKTLDVAIAHAHGLYERDLTMGWERDDEARRREVETGDLVSVIGQVGLWKALGWQTAEPRWEVQRGDECATKHFEFTSNLAVVRKAPGPRAKHPQSLELHHG